MALNHFEVAAIAADLGLDAEEIGRRKAYLELGEADLALLRALHERLAPRRAGFADDFYEHLFRFPALRAMLEPAGALERLKRAQAEYIDSLTGGEYEADYVLGRLAVGAVHQRIGLEPKWYLGAYRRYIALCLPLVWEAVEGNAQRFLATLDALIKVIVFDITLALDTYFHAHQRNLIAAKEFATRVLEGVPVGVLAVDRALTLRAANPVAHDLLELAPEAPIAGARVADIAGLAELLPAAEEIFKDLARRSTFEFARSRDEETRHLRFDLKGSTVADEPLLLIVAQDITAQKQAETALREAEQQFRQLAENIPQVFWIVDLATRRHAYVSPGYHAVWGRPVEEIRRDPTSWKAALHPEDRERVLAAMQKAGFEGHDLEFRVLWPDGSVRWVHDRAFPVRDAHASAYRLAGITEDVTERREVQERLLHLAHYDQLTALPNRLLFYDRLKQALAQARRNAWTVGILILDLDRFKLINDTLGHGHGDELLQQVAERLQSCLRAGDTIGRLGGDEFAVIVSALAEAEDAAHVAQKIRSAFERPFLVAQREMFITASIGITLYPEDSDDPDALIRFADTAMYRAKAHGRNNYEFYTGELNVRTLDRLELGNKLRRALERAEFRLQFQPKVNLATGAATGCEALLRWHPPDGKVVSPADFIPLLEDTGLIVPVGEWVLTSGLEHAKHWSSGFDGAFRVAINVSARQFQQRDFDNIIQRLAREPGPARALLEVEITESVLMQNPEDAAAILSELRGLGVRIALDDFGTGYSSLGYLRRFPLDTVKIDRVFVRELPGREDDAAIVRAVVQMAHGLGLRVVAEGVETRDQLEFLRDAGCDEAQGFLFSRPVDAPQLEQLLRERPWRL